MKPLLGSILSATRTSIKYCIKGVDLRKHCNYWPKRHLYISCKLLAEEKKVGIGNVFVDILPSEKPEFVPCQYANLETLDQLTLKKLRWMLQKNNLKQDIFLIGPPGPEKLRLASTFAQMTNHEIEYVTLSRDTTESDLKQRREIKNGTAVYEDQAAVKAALNGRILILDGIEKAERNVLPVLNNLLENREMPLEDGRLLVAASRYDKLLESNTPDELTQSKVMRVDDRFRVIALGLPVPKYRGHPLDPPLRSRFQAVDVGPKSFKDQLSIMKALAPSVPEEKLIEVASFGYAANAPESKAQGLPDFPLSSLPLAAQLMEMNPEVTSYQILSRLYPYKIFLAKEGHKMVEDLLDSLNIKVKTPRSSAHKPKEESRSEFFCPNEYHDEMISDLEDSIKIHDVCLVGPRGSGKSTLVRELASRLGVDVEPIMLYQDMSARDLWQQRSTLPNGDTIWRPSILFNAAIEGKIAVLDGLHRLNMDTLSTLQRLIHEREAQLFDGSRLFRQDRYEHIKSALGCDDQGMKDKMLFKVHEDFRVVALAEPPFSSGKSKSHWLSAESISMFFFHHLRPMRTDEEVMILEKLIDAKLPAKMKSIIKLAQQLRKSDELSSSLSTRQLLRIAKRLKEYPKSDPFELVEKACMARFLPRIPQDALYKAMEKYGIVKSAEGSPENKQLSCSVHDGILTIGQTSTPTYQKGNLAKVPDVVFYDTKQHLQSLESLLQDFLLGEHLLLVGNQGVGKNRLIDRLLSLLNRPREYIQLHRDTTVQSLTTSPQLDKGIVKFHDSPLVRAAREGSVLVVDEADKAPTQVTCILKTLVENGEMLLSDGRRILPWKTTQGKHDDDENIIRLHPDFQMVVLANRPGFPFLGNDFFAALGDVFSVHVVDNPSFESELALLKNFGPSLPDDTLHSLVKAFSQLRTLADEGQLSYPYSTREVINIVKHLEKYPGDGVIQTVANVFDFDAYTTGVNDVIHRVFHENGIPLGSSPDNVALAVSEPLSSPKLHGEWKISQHPLPSNYTTRSVKWSGNFGVNRTRSLLNANDARLLWFTEQKSNWKLPLGDVQHVNDMAIDQERGIVHVLATRPAALFSLDINSNQLTVSAFDRHLESGYNAQQFRLQTSCLNGEVIIFNPQAGKLVAYNTETGNLRETEYSASSTHNPPLTRFGQMWNRQTGSDAIMLAGSLPKINTLVFFAPNGQSVEFFNPEKSENLVVDVGFQINSVFTVNEDKLLIQACDNNSKFIFDVEQGQLKSIEETEPLDNVTSELKYHPSTGNLFTVQGHYGALVHIPQNTIKVWPGDKSDVDNKKTVLLPHHKLIATPVPFKDAPKSIDRQNSAGVLRLTDLNSQTLRYVPLPKLERLRRYVTVDDEVLLASLNENSLVTVDMLGQVRQWEITYAQLASALGGWKKNFQENLGQLTVERLEKSGDLSGPKVGKVDPDNTPHVGGNTWAGGTGGRDTAGLGGRGGPYRLDAGHQVHQVSDEDKAAVPEEIRRAAREMGQKAYQERLKQIQMDPLDAELYEKFASSVKKHVLALRNILGNLQARGKERQWMKHQTHGDLDDGKIIEGLTGEKNIYRRRGEREPELGTPAEKPKHLRLLVDVSGSMYRFNGHDRRLEREMAAVLLFMEALEGYSDQWRYDVIGHSGETFNLELVKYDRPPTNEKQRFDVLLNMHAHSQFCLAGDHTLEATRKSIADLSEATDIDEAFVILLSDANLSRYGIPAAQLAHALSSTENVRSGAVFIGSLGDQAERLSRQLPTGSAYVCMDLEKLPQIMQEIFASVILSR